MKKYFFAVVLAALFLLSSCAATAPEEDGKLHIVATTYPVYLFTTAVTEGMENVEVTQMVQSTTSCLHDYTLTVQDMKTLDRADIIIMNGAGLEDFMADALAQSGAEVIDCSEGVDLLLSEEHEGHDGHDHDEEYDPHYWMDPRRAAQMVDNIARGLGVDTVVSDALRGQGETLTSHLPCKELITFHDGFRYLADYLGLDILKAIEEEAGSEASAKEILEVTDLIKTHDIPSIFTEVNGSEATAMAVQRETGVKIYQLNMIMSGDGQGIGPYIDAMDANIKTILEALE